MKIVKSNKGDLENLKGFVEDDSVFNNYVEWRSHHSENYEDDVADMYSYIKQQNPQIESPEEKPLMMNFLSSKNEEFLDMRQRAKGKPVLSYLATKSAARLYDEIIDNKLADAAEAAKTQESERNEQQNKALKKAKNSMKLEIRKNIGKHKKEFDEAEKVLVTMAVAGSKPGCANKEINMKDSMELLKKMKSNESVKKIMMLAGKFQNLAGHKLMTRTTDNEKLVGIEVGGDPERIIPAEVAMLNEPEFENLKLIELLEGRLIQSKFEAEQPKTGGPIVVCIDESGSMANHGLIEEAKAFLFGMWQVAKTDQRRLMVVAFGGRNEKVTTEIKSVDNLMKVIESFLCSGSTCFESPLKEARKIIETGGEFTHADIVFITDDGGRSFNAKFLKDFNSFRKQTQTKVISLALLPRATNIKLFSDQVVYGYDSLAEKSF